MHKCNAGVVVKKSSRAEDRRVGSDGVCLNERDLDCYLVDDRSSSICKRWDSRLPPEVRRSIGSYVPLWALRKWDPTSLVCLTTTLRVYVNHQREAYFAL